MSRNNNEPHYTSYREDYTFLRMHTIYTDDILVKYSRRELHAMRMRIEEALIRYPKEINDYYNMHPEERKYTYAALRTFNYNALATLRKSLKIRKRKVTSITNDQLTANKAKAALKNKKTRDTIKDIILGNEQDEDLTFVSYEEVINMFGKDITPEELREKGFKICLDDQYKLDANNVDKDAQQKENKRYQTIEEIISLKIKVNGTLISPECLLLLKDSELRTLLKVAKLAKRERRLILSNKVKNANLDILVTSLAMESLKNMRTSELTRNILESNEHDDIKFLTLQEAYAIFGRDISNSELLRNGYKLYNPSELYQNDPENYQEPLHEYPFELSTENILITKKIFDELSPEEIDIIYAITEKALAEENGRRLTL